MLTIDQIKMQSDITEYHVHQWSWNSSTCNGRHSQCMHQYIQAVSGHWKIPSWLYPCIQAVYMYLFWGWREIYFLEMGSETASLCMPIKSEGHPDKREHLQKPAKKKKFTRYTFKGITQFYWSANIANDIFREMTFLWRCMVTLA